MENKQARSSVASRALHSVTTRARPAKVSYRAQRREPALESSGPFVCCIQRSELGLLLGLVPH
eukprot:6305269-Pyramimonas_sp.AAC.1